MITVFLLVFIALGFALILISLARKNDRKSSLLFTGKRIYSDTEDKPGELLVSHSLPLTGKPDYILKKDKQLIPVEYKTGKTPRKPYPNHILQLTAYCYLIEESYGKRPDYGIIKYPEKDFVVEYSETNKLWLNNSISEMLHYKSEETGFDFTKDNIYCCNKCREAYRSI